MAGSYPNAPGRKFAWDEDGTVMWTMDSSAPTWTAAETSTITFATTAEKIKMNDTSNQGTEFNFPEEGMAAATYFPELRNIDGLYWAMSHNRNSQWQLIHNIEYSADTTNGIDGTWTAAGFTVDTRDGDFLDVSTNGISISNSYRSLYTPVAWTSVRCIRWMIAIDGDLLDTSGTLHCYHIYGDIPTTQSPDRLLIFDNDTGAEFALPQDWGDVPRGVTLDKEIYFKNNSATLTANTITATFEDINPAPGGTSNTWYTIKQGAGAFNSSLTYSGTIAPGANSDVCTIRLTVADDEDISLQEARMQVNVGSWT